MQQNTRGHLWPRFWVSRTGQIDLSDAGFLVDPANLFSWASPESQPRTLVALERYRALALLGEPGMGKSTSLKEETDRLSNLNNDGANIPVHFDLRAYSSEELLYRRVFEGPELTAWKEGTSFITLHLDSLDEALLRIDSIANLLAAELPKLPTVRMSIRIACRTAMWPSLTLEPTLEAIWGKEACGIFELAPLRRIDVIAASKDRGIDPDAFFVALFSANAIPFAIKPLTLNLLLNLFELDGQLPQSLAELYRKGCLTLCEERNPSRLDSRRTGALNPDQRLQLASRLAAVTMLANRYAIWTGSETAEFPREDVTLSKVCGGREHGTFSSFDVNAEAIREVLDTGLFSSRGITRMGWAHQSYAEFLAATYLIQRNVSVENILRIFRHPSGGLIPQLLVTASWAASLKAKVRDELIRTDPIVCLRGDLANWDSSDRERLTESLLCAFEEARADDYFPGISFAYSNLLHPNLATQLRPFIVDIKKSEIARRAAFKIAEACKLKALQPQLLQVALDQTENPSLRAYATSALRTCGDLSIPGPMIALAKGELGPDPQDDIKGNALRILWRDYINASDLFSMISRPDEGYYGAYTNFLYELPDTLQKNDLLPALEWATTFTKGTNDQNDSDYTRKNLSDRILTLGWKFFEAPELREAYLDNVFAKLRNFGELFRGTTLRDRDEFLADVKSNTSRRHAFIIAASKRGLGKLEAMWLARSPFLQPADFCWLLSISPGGIEKIAGLDEGSICNLIDETFKRQSDDDFESLYNTAINWEMLWKRYAFIFEGVPLKSSEARQARETHNLMKQHERNMPPPLDPPPSERVRARLDQYESGDTSAWWLLNLDLTLRSTSRHYSDLEFIITDMPGWLAADQETRSRITHAAKDYLVRAQPNVDKWLGTTSFQRSDLAAFRAFVLLLQERPDEYRELGNDIWSKWTPVIVAVPTETGTKKAELFNTILSHASSHAPHELALTIRKLIKIARRRRRRQDNVGEANVEDKPVTIHFYFLRKLEGCWDNKALKAALYEELRNRRNSPGEFGALLEGLLKAKSEPARRYAIKLLRRMGKSVTDLGFVATTELLKYSAASAWPNVWAVISEDRKFGSELFLHLAQNIRYDTSSFDGLTETQLGELYVWLERTFPRETDPKHRSGEAHWVGPRESLGDMRDGILRRLAALGTIVSVQAIRRIVAELPQLSWLTWYLREAEKAMRANTWAPLTPVEVLQLTSSVEAHLVQSSKDLCVVLVQALKKYQTELHGAQSPIRSLWDRQSNGMFRPIEEDAISDHVKLFLQRVLVENGIIANREVEISRVAGAPVGQRTDIKIDALRKTEQGTKLDVITGIIETKGCWNAGLFSSLESQLYSKYMVRLGASVGIYLVGWFDKGKWDDTDSRKTKAPNCSMDEAREKLTRTAASLPGGFYVEPFLLDCQPP